MAMLAIRNACAKVCKRAVHTTPAAPLFWEKDRKGGYVTAVESDLTTFEQVRFGFRELKKEILLWKQEIGDKFTRDPIFYHQEGVVDYVWRFDNQDVLENFVVTSDSDHNEGFSNCKLEMSKSGRVLFSGYVDTRIPKDGRIKKAGYCNMRSIRCMKSFKRNSSYDWSLYNTLVLKIRGDGRSYLLNLSNEGYWDISWNDIYHYVLYTRGGPYWQIVKIPFSKFIFASKGRLQDKQSSLPSTRVTHFGISCGKIDGPFSLEIEYVGVEFDPEHEEEFAYEMYKTEKYIAGY